MMVAQRCGLPVKWASLMLISEDYRQGDDPTKLFKERDVTEAVEEQRREFDESWGDVGSKTGSETRPKASLCLACRKCEFFAAECLGKGVADPVIDLPFLNRAKIDRLAHDRIVSIRSIPDGFGLTEKQERIVNCVKTNEEWVDRCFLSSQLTQIQPPTHYLDFETVTTCLPLYPSIAPLTPVATQYSMHLCNSPGNIEARYDYLADFSRDCQRELAEELIDDAGTEGSIVHYSGFEPWLIERLATQFADLAPRLHALKQRLFDLLPVLREGFYHPGFKGSYSLKNVLPVLARRASYEDLGIEDGNTANAQFAKMATGQRSPSQIQKTRAALLKYCRCDTLGLVELHDRLLKYASGKG